MADPLGELLRSPLDDLPEPRLTRFEALVLVVAVIAGVATGWVMGAPADAVDTTATTAEPDTAEPAAIPPGWTDVGLGYGIGVSWMYTRGPDLLVGISVVNPAGTDPTVDGFTDLGFDHRGLGLWTVELSGGERLVNSREFFDLNAPGVVTLEFAGANATVDDVRSISLRPVSGSGTRLQQILLPITGLPVAVTDLDPIAVTERIVSTPGGTDVTDLTHVSIDRLDVDWSTAALAWSFEDAADIRIMIEAMVTIQGDTAEPVVFQNLVGGGAFLQRSFPPLSPARSGVTNLREVSRATGGSYTAESAAVDLTISWLRYGDDEFLLDLSGVVRLDPVE